MGVNALSSSNYYIPQSYNIQQSEKKQVNDGENKPTLSDDILLNNSSTAESYNYNKKYSSDIYNKNNNENMPPIYTGEEILSAQTDKASNIPAQLSEAEKKQVEELKKRDAEVKTHEQAHITAGGIYIKGGASYDYQTGPDGRQYAVGGHVDIDTSPVPDNPQATIKKAHTIIKAALAPAEPSGADNAAASKARQMIIDAEKELIEKNNSENSKKSKSCHAETDKNYTPSGNIYENTAYFFEETGIKNNENCADGTYNTTGLSNTNHKTAAGSLISISI